MSTTQRSNLIYPTVLQEEVVKGIAGMQIFGGSRAVVLNPSLQNGRNRVGADVTVPYFDSIGKAQLIPDGGAVTPKRLAMSSESAVVIHLGDAVSINTLAGMATQGRDPYQVARDMLLAGLAAKLEDIIVQRLAARAVSASMVYDGSSGNVSVAAINGTCMGGAFELSLACHGRVAADSAYKPIAAAEVQGIRVVRQGFHDYARGSVVEGTDPRGYQYFWFGLHGIEHTPGHQTDLEAIQDGYVSVTPLQLDLTHNASLAQLAERFA